MFRNANLTRDKIMAADDGALCTVEMPEWGGSVIVRALSAEAMEGLKELIGEAPAKLRALQASLVVLCVIDKTGRQVFSEDDIAELAGKSPVALDRICGAVLELSGLDRPSQEVRQEALRHVAGLCRMAERFSMTLPELLRRMGPVEREIWRMYDDLMAEAAVRAQLAAGAKGQQEQS